MKAVEVFGVSKIFPDKTKALSDISFFLEEGEFTVIGGSNGSGKSVLMSLIAGLDEPTSGTITKIGHCGLVFQDADCQILGETPEEDVAFGAKNFGIKKQDLSSVIDNALNAAGLGHKKHCSARMMSGGEKRRLAVAGILAINSSIIIFDEPFANLDWPGIKQVCGILKQLKEQKKTILVLTHELEKILALADRFIVLDRGEIKFNGSPDEGLKENLEQWGIRNPVTHGQTLEDLIWL